MNREEFEKLKKGDLVYKITEIGILELEVVNNDGYYCILSNNDRLHISPNNRLHISPNNAKGKTYFITKAEAEEIKDTIEKNKIKKQKMYKFECELNEELGINTFLIKY